MADLLTLSDELLVEIANLLRGRAPLDLSLSCGRCYACLEGLVRRSRDYTELRFRNADNIKNILPCLKACARDETAAWIVEEMGFRAITDIEDPFPEGFGLDEKDRAWLSDIVPRHLRLSNDWESALEWLP